MISFLLPHLHTVKMVLCFGVALCARACVSARAYVCCVCVCVLARVCVLRVCVCVLACMCVCVCVCCVCICACLRERASTLVRVQLLRIFFFFFTKEVQYLLAKHNPDRLSLLPFKDEQQPFTNYA